MKNKSKDVSNSISSEDNLMPFIRIYIKDYHGIDGMSITMNGVIVDLVENSKIKSDKNLQRKFMKKLQFGVKDLIRNTIDQLEI